MKLAQRDILLIAALLAASLVPLALLARPGGAQRYAEITVDGKPYRRIPLGGAAEDFVIETAQGHNTVHIHDGAVTVSDADCPDKICVRTAAAKKAGDIIACLPHKLLIEVKEGELP